MKKFLTTLLAALMLLTLLAPSVLAEGRVDWGEAPEAKKLTLFADCTWLPYDTLDGIIPQWITEETGITVELIKATDSNQIVMLVASGDLPDMIMTDNANMFRELSNSDMCYSYNELIEQYVPNCEVPEVEQNMNAYYSEDGNYYMLKNYFNTIEEIEAAGGLAVNNNQFYIRTDIFEAMGETEYPSNTEELMALLGRVKEQYPDMIPMVFQHRNYGAFASLVGLDLGMPKDADGNPVHQMSAPQFKDYLSVINQMYRAGYILEENFSFNSDEQMIQYMSNGQGFMFSSFGLDDATYTGYVRNADPEASLDQLPLMDNYARTFSVSGWAGTFITKDCADPEAAIKLIAWLKDGDNKYGSWCGVKGADWDWDENGNFVALERYAEAKANGAVDPTYTGVGFLLSATDYICEGVVGYATYSERVRAILDDSCARADFSNVWGLVSPVADSEEGVIYSELSDLMIEYFPIVCMSQTDEEFEANFAEMMGEADAIGIATYNAWAAETYAALCEQFGTV